MPFTLSRPVRKPSTKPLEPCCVEGCPDPLGGAIPKGHARPKRISTRRFGRPGVACVGCYDRLKNELRCRERAARRSRESQERVGPGEKLCARCRKPLPMTTNFFYVNKKRPDGFQSYCKVCHRAYQATGNAGGPFRPSPEAKRRADARYLAKPEVRARKAERDRRRCESPRVKLKGHLRNIRWKLKHATDPDRRARLETRLALVECELARIEEQRRAEAESMSLNWERRGA